MKVQKETRYLSILILPNHCRIFAAARAVGGSDYQMSVELTDEVVHVQRFNRDVWQLKKSRIL